MKTHLIEKVTAPVTPWELWFAVQFILLVGGGNRSGSEGQVPPVVRGVQALTEVIKDREKATRLSFRASVYLDMLNDERSKDPTITVALFIAAAELPMNDYEGFNPTHFFDKVKEITQRYSADEIAGILREGRQETLERALDHLYTLQEARRPRITGNDYCYCKSGKKFKKCHGMKESELKDKNNGS